MRDARTPYVHIDLAKIEHNAREVVRLCAEHGITVAGVTKGVCGHAGIAAAMLRGGVSAIADSRLDNLRTLRRAGVDRCMLLRMPALSTVSEVVAMAGVSLNSEIAVLRALAQAARRAGRIHDVILMMDLEIFVKGFGPPTLSRSWSRSQACTASGSAGWAPT